MIITFKELKELGFKEWFSQLRYNLSDGGDEARIFLSTHASYIGYYDIQSAAPVDIKLTKLAQVKKIIALYGGTNV